MDRRGVIALGLTLLITAVVAHGYVIAAVNAPSYQIRIQLDPQKHFLYGEEEISFTNNSDNALNAIYLHLYPNRFMDKESVYAREKGIDAYDWIFPNGPDNGYTFIEALKLNGANHDYTIDDTIMRIGLKKPLSPGATATLSVKFRVKIPDAIMRFGYDSGNYYISWWYPRLAAYDDQGWHPYQMHGIGPDEPYDNFARYRVQIVVPPEMIIGATGIQNSIIQSSSNTKTLDYAADNVHDFAWVADSRYRVQTLSWNGITIRSLYFPEDEAAGKCAAQYAKDAIAYFSEHYGKYPYKNLTVAETRMAGGAMEYPQLIMVSYQLYRLPNFFTLFDEVIAHETSHQWFYGMLMNDQTNEAWLDEGFATFSELCYIEHKYGKTGNLLNITAIKKIPIIGPLIAGKKFAAHIPSSREQVVNSYLMAARLGTEAPLLTPRDQIKPGYTPLVYQRGALTLFALQYIVGQQTFDKIIKTYVHRYQFKRVTTREFINVAEEVTERNLGWLFDEWLRSTAWLDYALVGMKTHPMNGKFVTRVAIRNNGKLRMPVDVQATLTNGETIIKRFWPIGRLGTLEFITDRPVKKVVIDPDKLLPDIDRSNNASGARFTTSPLVKMEGGGLILGVSFASPDARINGEFGYATGTKRPVYSLSFVSSPWIEAGKATKRGSGIYLRTSIADNGHDFSATAHAGYFFSTWTADLTGYFNDMEIQPFYTDFYDALDYQSKVIGVNLADTVSLETKQGFDASLELSYKAAFAALGSDFEFTRYALRLTLEKRVAWCTQLNARLFWGWLCGQTPNREERFDIRKDGGLRTFNRSDNHAAVINLSLLMPITPLHKVDVGPLSFSIGVLTFGDLGWFGDNLTAVRAEAGWGLACSPYGMDIHLRLEQIIWVNTQEDGGTPGLAISVDLGI